MNLFRLAPLFVAIPALAQSRYDVAVLQNVMIPMRDGVKLATDIYRPARNGVPVDARFPVLLERTPYTKEMVGKIDTPFVPHGYATNTDSLLEAAARAASDPAAIPALRQLESHVRDYILALPLRPGTTPLKFAPDYERWLIEAMSHGDYDDFWKNSGSSVIDH